MFTRLCKRRLLISELCESAECSERAVTSLRVKLPLRWATLVLCFHQFQEKFSFPSWMQQIARTSLNPLHTLILVLAGQIPAKTKATNTNKFNNSPTRSAHGQCVCLQCHGARALPYIQARSVLCTIRVARDLLNL